MEAKTKESVQKITITEHAYKRAKERLSLNKKAFERLALKAYETGIKHSDTKGKLNKYLTSLYMTYKSANNIRVYGENVFLFCSHALVTIYQLTYALRKYTKIEK